VSVGRTHDGSGVLASLGLAGGGGFSILPSDVIGLERSGKTGGRGAVKVKFRKRRSFPGRCLWLVVGDNC
jgi:hypothetical protein